MPDPMENAKPCPFCGGKNLATPPGIAVVVCGDCEAGGPIGVAHPKSDAMTILAGVQKWNQRVEE